MTELEKAQLRNVDADTDTKLIQVQVISAEEARKRVADDPDTPYVDLDRTVQPPGPPAEPDPNAPPRRQGSDDAWTKVIHRHQAHGARSPTQARPQRLEAQGPGRPHAGRAPQRARSLAGGRVKTGQLYARPALNLRTSALRR